MGATIQIQVYEQDQLAFSDDFDGPIELGRQSEPAEEIFTCRLEGGRRRVVIAHRKEQTVSRRHALIEPLPGGRIRVTNTSSLIPLTLPEGAELAPSATAELPIPVTLTIGRRTILVNEV